MESSLTAAQREIALPGTVQGTGWCSITGGSSAAVARGRAHMARASAHRQMVMSVLRRLLPGHLVLVGLSADGVQHDLLRPICTILYPVLCTTDEHVLCIG